MDNEESGSFGDEMREQELIKSPKVVRSTPFENSWAPTFANIKNNFLQNHLLKLHSQEVLNFRISISLVNPGFSWRAAGLQEEVEFAASF